MAEGGIVPKLGGYDYEFTDKVADDLECLVCQLPMKDPVQIVECGHRLCNICMESLLRNPSRIKPTCPADRLPLFREKIFPDTACHRKILNLTVKCSHSGCPWTGELRAVEKHQSECLLKVVQCPNSGCSEKLTKQDMKTHVTSECSWRKINCEYCQKSLVFNQKQRHFDVCQKFPVQCTNECGLRDIPREKLDVHIRDECPKTEVNCEYRNLGCEAVFPRSNAKSHCESQVERHLNVALRSLEATRHQVHDLVSLVKDLSQQMEGLMTKDNEKSQQIERLMTKDNEKSQEMERLMTTVQDQKQKIEMLKIGINTNASFVWEIANIQAILDMSKDVRIQNEDIVSEPFYFCRNVYQLRIILKPNGSSLTKKEPHFAFYVRAVRSDYLLLPLEFKAKVRVTLIDQNPCKDKREDISGVIDFSQKKTFPRHPFEKDNKNDFGGLSVTQDKLRTGSYIMNDAIFITANKV